jgi:hypothetical protein
MSTNLYGGVARIRFEPPDTDVSVARMLCPPSPYELTYLFEVAGQMDIAEAAAHT